MTLFVKDIVSIGAVNSGDNPEADIVFWKKDESAVSAETTNGDGMSFDVSALPDDAQEHISNLEKTSAETIAALEAQIVDLTPPVDPVEVEVEKASDEVQALIKSLRDERDEDRKTLEVEVAKRRDSEFITKVREDGLEKLLGDANEMGPVLRELDDAAPDAFGKLYRPMLAAMQRVEFAKALAEFGSDEGDADPQAQKAAWIAKQKEQGTDKTDAQLASAFWAEHPDAVAASREK